MLSNYLGKSDSLSLKLLSAYKGISLIVFNLYLLNRDTERNSEGEGWICQGKRERHLQPSLITPKAFPLQVGARSLNQDPCTK